MSGDKFKDKYRIPSTRLADYDYSSPGRYFITICVKDRRCCFGEIKNGEVVLSDLGKIAGDCWLEITKHFKNLELDEFVVMPNHVHGIIIILDDNIGDVETQHAASLRYKNKFGPSVTGSLPAIICSYKSAVTKLINQKYGESNFAWQERYYDHVIKNDKECQRISQYILGNSIKWSEDENNPLNFKNEK
ncbi:MAG: transposase [Patescibacteria group bacterium]